MGVVKNVASSPLLACGIVLTSAGLSSALGFTVGGMLAAVAAIAALMYAGGARVSLFLPSSPSRYVPRSKHTAVRH